MKNKIRGDALCLKDPLAYVACYDSRDTASQKRYSGLFVVNISNPTQVEGISYLRLPPSVTYWSGQTMDIEVSDTIAYLAA